MMGYGYENAAGDRISALIDMINGGGPGRSGDTFEGGGILSLLANAVAKPYGSVRERPGHTPMGAADPMDVLRPIATERVSTTALPEPQSFETEAAAPRRLTEDEAARLANLPESFAPPDLLSFFNGLSAGAPLSPEESMVLDALLASASFSRPQFVPEGLPTSVVERAIDRAEAAPRYSFDPQSFETEAAAPRYLTEDDAARLAVFGPLERFRGIPAGALLTPREVTYLDALLNSSMFK
jgi:hypothetical protein